MNKKFNVIKINGFKGLLLAGFIVGCLIAGFLIFPGWIFKGLWNFMAGYFEQMPVMTLIHGIMLWCIIALSLYATNRGNFAISFGTSTPMPNNEERIKEIIKQINENNAKIMPISKKSDNIEDESDDKITK